VKKAFRTTWGGVTSVVAAESAAKARAVTVRAALEVYTRKQVRFVDVKVRRAAEYDEWAAADTTGHCWDEKILAVALRVPAGAKA